MNSPLNASEMFLLPGTLLFHGKYRIVRHISSGGFGNTYEAIDTSFDEQVAIKELFIKGICGRLSDKTTINVTLDANKQTFEAFLNKFKKEAKRLREIHHESIVAVRDLFEENDTVYYVMDYIDGESLDDVIKSTCKPISESILWEIIPQLLSALECVHIKNIWHLDIKPGNVMVSKSGKAILIDFGASKQVRDSTGSTVTQSSAIALTQGFAPTELMEQNFDKFGPWTDFYSLGATLYFCISQKTPPMPSDIVEFGVNKSVFSKDTSNKLIDLIVWLLNPQRTMRPQSSKDIINWLDSYKAKEILDSPQDDDHIDKSDFDTIVVPKKQAGERDYERPLNNNRKKVIFGGVVLCVLVICGMFYLTRGIFQHISQTTDVVEYGLQKDSVDKSQDYPIEFENSLGTYEYIPDDPRHGYNSSNRPDGFGTAKFKDGRVYKGTFSDGNLEGVNVHFTFPNGDSFDGTFKNNMFSEGRYTIKEDGSYFEGTFKNGQPDKGEWHDANK